MSFIDPSDNPKDVALLILMTLFVLILFLTR